MSHLTGQVVITYVKCKHECKTISKQIEDMSLTYCTDFENVPETQASNSRSQTKPSPEVCMTNPPPRPPYVTVGLLLLQIQPEFIHTRPKDLNKGNDSEHVFLSNLIVSLVWIKPNLKTILVGFISGVQCYQSQITKFMGSTWGPPGACRPQMGPCWPHEPCYLGCCIEFDPRLIN